MPITGGENVVRSVEVLRIGSFQPMSGEPVSFSARDLEQIVSSYDAANAPAPVVIGHPKTDDPAFGWAQGFHLNRNTLVADLGDLEPSFSEAVKKRRYRKVSISLFSPASPANPKPGSWYPRHIGFLGAAAPAIPGLKPVSFSGTDKDTVTIEFSEEDIAYGLARSLRGLREFIVEKFSREEADKVLPEYAISDFDRMANPPEAVPTPSFSESKDNLMTGQTPASASAPADPAFAEREAALLKREKELQDREEKTRHDSNVSFSEGLVQEGRILPVHKDNLISVLDALEKGSDSVSFSEGKTDNPVSALKSILKELPKTVPLGANTKEIREPITADFAAPQGKTVDPEGLELHRKALHYQREHKDMSYLDAVQAVQGRSS